MIGSAILLAIRERRTDRTNERRRLRAQREREREREREKMRSDGSSSSRNNSAGGESVVVDWGRHKSSCGYCKSSVHNSISHGSSRLISYFSSIFFIILLNYYTIFFFFTDCFVYVHTFGLLVHFLWAQIEPFVLILLNLG